MSRENPKAADKGREQRAAIAAAQRAARRANRGTGQVADWQSADPERIVRLIATASMAGALVTFGYTRDQGAYMVGFFADGDRYSEYCRPSEDLSQFLELLISDYEG